MGIRFPDPTPDLGTPSAGRGSNQRDPYQARLAMGLQGSGRERACGQEGRDNLNPLSSLRQTAHPLSADLSK